MTPAGQTFHTGNNGGGVDYPPPGLLCCPKGVGEKSALGGLSVRILSIGIPPQGTSIGQGSSERTPYTVLVSRPYLDPGGWWGGLAAPNYMLPLLMGFERHGCKV